MAKYMDDFKKFRNDGYLVLRNILDKQSIIKLRSELSSEFEEQNKPKLLDIEINKDKTKRISNRKILNQNVQSYIIISYIFYVFFYDEAFFSAFVFCV